jgi:cold shock protein
MKASIEAIVKAFAPEMERITGLEEARKTRYRLQGLTWLSTRSYKQAPGFWSALLGSRLLGRSQVISQNSDDLYCTVRATSANREELTMATGTVKWFNPTKGYGFIQPQGGGKDVFVHISAVEKAGLNTLNEGQSIQYEVVSNRGKESAENLKVG